MLTEEELLRPRYKVINDFPQWGLDKYEKGDILEKFDKYFMGRGAVRSILEEDIDKYPAIFKKLHWFEDRNPGELPEAVIYKNRANGQISIFKLGEILLEGDEWISKTDDPHCELLLDDSVRPGTTYLADKIKYFYY